MKKIVILLLATSLMVTSCADSKVIDSKRYRPYGLMNEDECANDSIHYEVAIDATISGILFSELFFIPTVYVFGYHWYEPVCKESEFKRGMNSVIK
jgi:hypothetical protein